MKDVTWHASGSPIIKKREVVPSKTFRVGGGIRSQGEIDRAFLSLIFKKAHAPQWIGKGAYRVCPECGADFPYDLHGAERYTEHWATSHAPQFYVPLSNGIRAPVPANVAAKLKAAKSPEEIEQVITQNEDKIAGACEVAEKDIGGRGGFLGCDEAAELMSQALKYHRIPHESVVGKSDEGSSHAWVRVNGKDYDPTHQGYGEGSFRVVETFP